MVKGQFFIIEATIAGIALIIIVSLVIFFGTTQQYSFKEKIMNNYCEDSLSVLINKNLLENSTDSVEELNKLIPKNIIYCLKIDNQEITPYSCSKIKDNIMVCKAIYSYLDNGIYYAKEVQLLLS